MKPRFLLILSLFVTALNSGAQQPDQLLQQWYLKAPVEKVWLHTDRDHYLAGETAWFKAYLSSDFQPDTLSTVLVTELTNMAGTEIVKNLFPVVLGTAFGQLELPDSLPAGTYMLSAYTPSMLNNGKEYVFNKQLQIQGKDKTVAAPVTTAISLQFFPEGGNFVAGFNNVVAFKATRPGGYPENVTGKILNSKGEQITGFTSFHDGMGFFELTPETGETYTAVINGGAPAQTFVLPQAAATGVLLALIPHPQGAFFELHQREPDPVRKAAYMIGQMQHHVVFRQQLVPGKDTWEGVLNTTNLHSGIVQVTVFTEAGLPLAERLFFVNNKEYLVKGEIRTDTLNTSPKGKNILRIALKDTIQGSLSVAVTDAGFANEQERPATIYSGLLLTSDLKGYIHQPAWYFSSESDTVKTALDLLMMTQGWRRFRWEELAKKIKEPLPFADPQYITITGKISLDGSKKGYGDKTLLALINAEGLKNNAQFFNTDQNGSFRIDSLLFFGDARIFILDIRGKRSRYIDVKMTSDPLGRPYPVIRQQPVDDPAEADPGTLHKRAADYAAYTRAKGLLLEEVTLTVKKKTPAEILDDNYARGMFSGQSGKIYDLVNTEEFIPDGNVFDYLIPRVPGLNVTVDGFEYMVYYRQGPTVSSLGSIPMTVYLNEIETDPTIVATIPATEIAMVKIYSTFTAASGAGAGGALAIYTRKGNDVKNSTRGDVIRYNGFTVVKEFFVPAYKTDPSMFNKPDNRITIDWRPNIFVNNINPVIPLSFYNTDRAKRFRVVVEGMTTDGKLICIEKIIQ